MSILKSMKEDIAKSGGSKGKILFIKADTKRRVRFLVDFEKGLELVFHDSFAKGVNCVCAKELGKKKCKFCDNDDLRTRKNYAWPVYDYDANEVRILLYAVNNCTPIPALISMYETYGTITDRDYVLERKGKQQSTSYSVIPMDKAKFKSKVKTPTRDAMIKMIGKAFSPDIEVPVDDDDDDEVINYEDMSAKELYQLCKERGLDPRPKKSAEYYIELLEELDEEDKTWDNSDDEDDWDDNDTDSEEDDDDDNW